MASAEDVAALVKRVEALEKKDRHRKKALDRATEKIEFLTKIINNSFAWQSTAPVLKYENSLCFLTHLIGWD